MISNRLYVGFRMHFFTLFGSVTNLTFTLFRNCRFCHFYTTHGCVLWLPHTHVHVSESILSGMTLHKHLDRFCHFYTPFNRSIICSTVFAYHSIGLYSMCGWSLYWHRVWCDLTNVGIKIHLSDRLCRFYVPFNWSNIGSTVFAHVIGLYSMCVDAVSTSCLEWRYTSISIDSVIFTHHSIGLSSVPPFLRTIQ